MLSFHIDGFLTIFIALFYFILPICEACSAVILEILYFKRIRHIGGRKNFVLLNIILVSLPILLLGFILLFYHLDILITTIFLIFNSIYICSLCVFLSIKKMGKASVFIILITGMPLIMALLVLLFRCWID